ncbi:MAG: carbohydrate ABC transporter permease, partial [Actinobacteria bacterium]|nr:carbohydrate ABC transporter permease [Actinomycetota bacterium]
MILKVVKPFLLTLFALLILIPSLIVVFG